MQKKASACGPCHHHHLGKTTRANQSGGVSHFAGRGQLSELYHVVTTGSCRGWARSKENFDEFWGVKRR